MAQARYFILPRGEQWAIRFKNEEFGPYATRAEATLFAIEAAQKLGCRGQVAEVLLLGEGGHARPEWRFGRDPYPPRLKDGSFSAAA